MTRDKSVWATYGATSVFVALWSSGAIFARLGLDHASTFVFLVLRFAAALVVLVSLAAVSRPRPAVPRGARGRVIAVGLLVPGGYSICYFLALDHGVTPGLLATVLGAQPLLTLLWTERRVTAIRLGGLVLAVAGLALVVHDGLTVTALSPIGVGFALGALGAMTAGAVLQKSIALPPLAVAPLQYAASLVLCLACAPWQPLWIDPTVMGVLALAWLAIVISVVAQLLLYRLIQRGNLVNVTSLFYLVPIVTAAMDHWLLGSQVSAIHLCGMAAILAGLAIVRTTSIAMQGRAAARQR